MGTWDSVTQSEKPTISEQGHRSVLQGLRVHSMHC